MPNVRISTVDFARGLLAIGVLFYHTLIYEGGPALPQIGRHGVYAFFVISGFALYTSYRDRLATPAEVRAYFLARLWRIAPLYYTAVVLSVMAFGTDGVSLSRLFFNASLLMGLANPGEASMVVGGWSIGIEMVFYLIFPAVVMIAAGSVRRLAAITIVLILAQLAFANHVLSGTTLVDAWGPYTQPIAFGGYFAAGCLLAECYRRAPQWKGASASWGITFAALLIIAAAPSNSEAILTGLVGAALVLATIVLVAGIAFLPEPKGSFRDVAEWVGRLSYPIYLLHPIVYHYAAKIPVAETHIPVTFLVTVALSDLVNRAIERPAMRFSKSLRRVAT